MEEVYHGCCCVAPILVHQDHLDEWYDMPAGSMRRHSGTLDYSVQVGNVGDKFYCRCAAKLVVKYIFKGDKPLHKAYGQLKRKHVAQNNNKQNQKRPRLSSVRQLRTKLKNRQEGKLIIISSMTGIYKPCNKKEPCAIYNIMYRSAISDRMNLANEIIAFM
jgi:hypothetical protein